MKESRLGKLREAYRILDGTFMNDGMALPGRVSHELRSAGGNRAVRSVGLSQQEVEARLRESGLTQDTIRRIKQRLCLREAGIPYK